MWLSHPLDPLARLRLVLGRDLTLGTLLERLAHLHGDRALVDEVGGRSLTVEDAADLVAGWAGRIIGRIEPGEAVVIAGPNSYDQLLLGLAVSRAGGIPALLNDRLRPAEVTHVIADAGAKLVLRSPVDLDPVRKGRRLAEVPPPLATAVPADPSEVAALFYTSGTTGSPKGVELSHRALLGGVASGAAWPGGLRRDEAVFSLPLAHIFGFTAAVGLACAGVPACFLGHFNPVHVLDAIEQRRATVFIGVPAMYRMLLEAGAETRDLRSVRVWLSGADAMPTELAGRFKRMGASVTLPLIHTSLGEATFAEGYGLVESGGGVAAKVSLPGVSVGLGGSVGMALPGYRFRVVTESGRDALPGGVGELWIKGPGILKGYHGDPTATAAALTPDGWLRSGDLARKGPLGMIVFAGRHKDVVKHGGYSVYAVEVEHVLEEHPDVLEAAVVGLPDDRLGEVPVAAVRLRPGVTLGRLHLGRWAQRRLSDYKVPQRFVATDHLPRSGTHKVQRAEVLALFDPPGDADASTRRADQPRAQQPKG